GPVPQGPHEVASARREDGAVEESPRARHGEQGGAAHRARRLAEDRDLPRVAPEGLDLVAHPFEGRDLIEEPLVAGGGQALAEPLAEAQEAEGPEAGGDGAP